MKENNRRALYWTFVVFLVASPRLFEEGISLDPAIYSTMAHHFAEHGGWRISAGKYFFPDFTDHPYLFEWILGGFFRLFGASDYTSRLPNLLFGSFSVFFLFRFVARNFGVKVAHYFSFVTMLTAPFVGRFATAYLEITYFFFFVASLDYFDLSLKAKQANVFWRSVAVSAALFVAAFFTKGIALLPGLALLYWWGAISGTERATARKALGLWTVLMVAIAGIGIAVQSANSPFPFWSGYFQRALFTRAAQSKSLWRGEFLFLLLIFKLHFAHVLVGLAALPSQNRRLFWFAIGGVVLFAVANGVLGMQYHHYTYSVLPFVNLLTVMGLLRLGFDRILTAEVARKWAFRFGIAFQVFWNLAPIPMRKKPFPDFFQFRPQMASLKHAGLTELQGVELTDTDWLYPAMSLWYWKFDTKLTTAAAVEPGAVVVQRNAEGKVSQLKGFRPCATAPRYELWVSAEWWDACFRATQVLKK